MQDSIPFQILALDGGGIKGLFSATYLARLEEDLNCTITDHFDLITGTSTGGIIAAALGAGIPPRDIVQFYESHGPEIFKQSKISRFLHDKASFWGRILSPRYSSTPLKAALLKRFGDLTLGASTKRLIIPSYNLGENDMMVFKTRHHVRYSRDHKLPLWQICMATTAAPTYFKAFHLKGDTRLIDGGVWANNPSMLGIIEALTSLDVPLANIRLLNIGTSHAVKHLSESLDEGGVWQWKNAGVEIALHGQDLAAFNQAKLLLGDNAYRVNPIVPDGRFGLDRLNFNALRSLAETVSRTTSPEIKTRFLSHQAPKFTPIPA